MVNPRIAFMLMLSAASLAHCGRGNDFGSTFGATTLGSALGTTVGTVVGNAISNPSPRRRRIEREVIYTEPVERVHVIERGPAKRVHIIEHVPTPMPSPRKGKRARLNREKAQLQAEIENLSMERDSIERRIRSLEQELSDTETAIDIRKQSLRNIEQRQLQLSEPVCVTKGPEFAEVTVH